MDRNNRQQMSVLVIGDVMLDRYIGGVATRISPEAPVPVVEVESEFDMLGGAANVAKNLALLGDEVILCGALGFDKAGSRVRALAAECAINLTVAESARYTTTCKTRVISNQSQIVRLDREEIYEDSEGLIAALELINFDGLDLVVVSDYAKGVVSDEVMAYLKSKCKRQEISILVDPKGMDWNKYQGVDLIKPNLKEVKEVLRAKLGSDNADSASLIQLRKDLDCEYLLVTQGGRGMTLVNEDGCTVHEAQKVDVFDVCGAGDTAIAVLAHMIRRGTSIEVAIDRANLASSYVVTKPQTYAISKVELSELTKEMGAR